MQSISVDDYGRRLRITIGDYDWGLRLGITIGNLSSFFVIVARNRQPSSSGRKPWRPREWLPAALADFDGDGKADPAVWDEARRVWQVRMSGSNYALVTSPENWL